MTATQSRPRSKVTRWALAPVATAIVVFGALGLAGHVWLRVPGARVTLGGHPDPQYEVCVSLRSPKTFLLDKPDGQVLFLGANVVDLGRHKAGVLYDHAVRVPGGVCTEDSAAATEWYDSPKFEFYDPHVGVGQRSFEFAPTAEVIRVSW